MTGSAYVTCSTQHGKQRRSSSVGHERDSCQGIPWPSVVAMRHRLIHGYFDVDLDRVWDTVADDLPPLIEALKRALGADPV